jgi:uncharacterized protein (DUF2252 family)
MPEALLRNRFELMGKDAFAFFRGTCSIFYEDLHGDTVCALPHSPQTWISGDLHIANFGTYRGSTGLVYFDINDFDEAALAPALWEVSRLAASIIVSYVCRGIDEAEALAAARHCVDTYAATLAAGKAMYIESNIPEQGEVGRVLRKATILQTEDLLRKETKVEDGRRRFRKDREENVALNDNERDGLINHFEDWLKSRPEMSLDKYRVKDVVFRISGTGSVGLNRYMFLLHWEHEGPGDYLILDMKEAGSSSIPALLNGIAAQPAWNSEAERIVQVQRMMQAVSPPVLHTTRFGGKDYVVLQRQPEKKKVDFEELDSDETIQVVDCMARLTAYAQLRSAGWKGAANVDDLIDFGMISQVWRDGLLDYVQVSARLTMEYYVTFKDIGRN